MASFDLPFNFNPNNVDVKLNANYTVPAGFYARVTAIALGSGDLITIDGTEAVTGQTSAIGMLENWFPAGTAFVITGSTRITAAEYAIP